MPSDEITLTAEPGRKTGSGPSKRLRVEGKIPGVVYGHGNDPMSVAVVRRDLRAALTTEAGMNALINLDVGGDVHLTIVRDVQRNPVRNEVTHVDFIIINRDEIITVEVPIVFTGEAKAVMDENGNVDQQSFTLTVNAKPGSIPNELTLDISEMTIGDTLRVSDIALPEGATTDADPDEAIAVAMITRSTLEVEAEEAEAEAAAEAIAEGGAAEGEGGEAAEGGEASEGGEDAGE
jgi:large subunit ribosomal protein L25